MDHLTLISLFTITALCITSEGAVPEVHLSPEEKTVSPGDEFKLICRVSSSSNLRVTWLLNGEEVTETDRSRGIITKAYNARRERAELKGVNADDNNVGRYQCRAVNDEGEDVANADIHLEGGTSHEIECEPEDQTFCQNGGTCLMYVGSTSADDKHCRCTSDFEGHQCQRHSLDFIPSTEWWNRLGKKEVGAIVGVVIALFVVALIGALYYRRYRQRSQQDSQQLTMDSVPQDAEKGSGITNQAAEQSDRSWILQNGGYPKDAIGQ